MVERRKHKRFKVQGSAFVVLGAPPWPHSTKVGQIIDMSMHGLAFSYIADEGQSNSSFELGIFLADNSFHLRQIPFETISDVKTNEVPLSSITMRRRGVQFGELTHNQISQLEYFIRNHTISNVEVPKVT